MKNTIFKFYEKYFDGDGIKEDRSYIGMGFPLADRKKEQLQSIDILNTNRKNHLFIIGTTGVGKTKATELLVRQDIEAGRNVVVIDPKSDMDMFNTVIGTAIKCGRKDELMFLTPIYPEMSIEINPTSHYYMPEEVVEHVMAAVPADDAFFYNVAKEATISIVQALVLKRKAINRNDIKINLEEIAQYAYYQGLAELKASIENIDDTSLQDDIQQTVRLLSQILASPVEYFSKVSTTLRTTLNIMVTGNIGKVLGNAKENHFVDRLESGKGVILYVQTGTMLARETANIIGKEIISMIQSVVGRYYLSGKVFPKPLCLHIDELSNVVYRGIQDLYNKGRTAGVWIQGATQSIADMIAVIGEDGAKQLLDNTNTKIIMRAQDLESATSLSQYGGLRKQNTPIVSASGAITSREVDNYAILPQEILRLKKREFFFFGFEGQFVGKTRTIKPINIDIKLPNILQSSFDKETKGSEDESN